jgi:hypothetical protein
MWLEAILSKDDFAKVAGELSPLRIDIAKGGSIALSTPRDLELVPELGLRMTVTLVTGRSWESRSPCPYGRRRWR